ncbi:unnamed protein product [Amoebophrya sp. A25]|nr:unnamed protein product [Amoebophrya sp. A25]|eukprot:GSA25T00007499001.1
MAAEAPDAPVAVEAATPGVEEPPEPVEEATALDGTEFLALMCTLPHVKPDDFAKEFRQFWNNLLTSPANTGGGNPLFQGGVPFAAAPSGNFGRSAALSSTLNLVSPGTSGGARAQTLEVLKDCVLALYDEGIFPADDFVRRAQVAVTRKEIPQPNEWFLRAMEMLLALSERRTVAQMQAHDCAADLAKWLHLFTMLERKRETEKIAKAKEVEEIVSLVHTTQMEIETLLMQCQEELGLQERLVEDWQAESKLLKRDRRKIRVKINKLDAEQAREREKCAEFLSKMLERDCELQKLAQVIPRYASLEEEIEAYTEENEELEELLGEIITQSENRVREQSLQLEACDAAGKAMMGEVESVLTAYTAACANADKRVEDIYPYAKVPTRPGGYSYYRAPGEPQAATAVREKELRNRRQSVETCAAKLQKLMPGVVK